MWKIFLVVYVASQRITWFCRAVKIGVELSIAVGNELGCIHKFNFQIPKMHSN